MSWSGAALLPDRELRRAFDYWLNLTGELSRDDIRALVAQWLAATAPADVAQRALDLFDRYLGLRAAVARLDADEPLADRLARLHALRVEWLGREAAAAFFADEERDAMLALERRRIATDRALSAAERGERIAALDAALGGPERVAREADAEPWLAEAQTRELDAGGADGATRAVTLPASPQITWIGFSADGARFAFTNTRDTGIDLWIGESATGRAHAVSGLAVNGIFGGGCIWVGSGGQLLCMAIPPARGAAPLLSRRTRRARSGRADAR